MSKSLNTQQPPTHEEITARAHRIYELEGRPERRSLEHWAQAEAQLIAERNEQAAETPSKPAATEPKRARATKPRVSKRTRSTLPISTRPRRTELTGHGME